MVISLSNISRIYSVGGEHVHALNDISLDVVPGEYISIMGPSGSGKSTLLNSLGLLDRPNRGHYSFEGRETTTLKDDDLALIRRQRIGFVFQFFHLVPRLTAAENVELPLVIAGITPAERRTKVQEILASIGLADRTGHRPDQLSGGQRQRVAIARAAITRPSLLLADEPTGNLDRSAGKEVVDILEKLNRQGITLIMVTHDPDLGKRARRQLVMVDGAIQSDQQQNSNES